ncbi:hypothetical protein KSP39_PZI023360 [Platanthera zijinensis]|uniref:Uncharacterized protein n=1 Tax=Platanthera zijinensis TaxID=2320716 RepID=A0AAP0AV60_9ASPA
MQDSLVKSVSDTSGKASLRIGRGACPRRQCQSTEVIEERIHKEADTMSVAGMAGSGCGLEEEVVLSVGGWALRSLRRGGGRREDRIEGIKALEKIDSKTPIASRRHFISRKQKEHTSKDGLVCPSLANGESKPLIKPTKVSCKTILPPSVPSKEACMEITEIKKNALKPLPDTSNYGMVSWATKDAMPSSAPGSTVATFQTNQVDSYYPFCEFRTSAHPAWP